MGIDLPVSDKVAIHGWLKSQAEAAAAPHPEPMFCPLPGGTRYVVGLDLGQAQDFTALCVVEHQQGLLDHGNAHERRHGLSKQTEATRVNVRHLERLKLKTSYPEVVQFVCNVMSRPPLCVGDGLKPAELVCDDTGVGRPVSDLLLDAGLAPIRVTITGSLTESTPAGLDRWHVGKSVLISRLDALLHTGTLKFAATLSESAAMREELANFRRNVTAAGRATFQARVGRHDDLVLCVAIACWHLNQPGPNYAQFGRY
jgi:hypothetical protein